MKSRKRLGVGGCLLCLLAFWVPLARAEAPSVIEYGFAPLPQAGDHETRGLLRMQDQLLTPAIRQKLAKAGAAGHQLAMIATASELGAPLVGSQSSERRNGGGSASLLPLVLALLSAAALVGAVAMISRRRRAAAPSTGLLSPAAATRAGVLVAVFAGLAAVAVSAGSAPPTAPAGFFGIGPQNELTQAETERMEQGGIEGVRVPVLWSIVETAPNTFDWRSLDQAVTVSAKSGLTILPFLYNTPEWVAGKATTLPVANARQRSAWTGFLEAAVQRYGPRGEFWAAHSPGSANPVPKTPIRNWQIWNEENFFYFTAPVSPSKYARLVKLSAPAIHSEDPGAKVILGGLFGRPKGKPPRAMFADRYLDKLYRSDGIKASFDGVALHPYAPDTASLALIAEGLRAVMRKHGDAGAGLYVTEVGWGSQGKGGTGFEKGLQGQANQLTDAYGYLLSNRRRLNLKQVYWFSWKDAPGSCNFCDSAGLFRAGKSFKPKPAWHAFVKVTGGRP